METHYINLPFTAADIIKCHAGDLIYLSGKIIGARDAAHKRLHASYQAGNPDFDINSQVIYYVGPTPAFGEYPIGSAGPTTSARMDTFTPLLMEHGLRITIGKGERSQEIRDNLEKYQGLYLVATGGVGALLSQCILDQQVLLYDDLGPESLKELTVKDFPVFVGYDCHGNDIFQN